MPSWSEVVVPNHLREKEASQGKLVQKKEPPLLCKTCKRRNAIVCEDCKKRPLYQGSYCGGCYVERIWRTLGSDSMSVEYMKASKAENDPPLECKECKTARRYNDA